MEKYIRVYMDFFGYDIAEDIIFEVTGGLSGSRQTVRKNKIPKIHQTFVDDLIKAMNKVIKKRTDNEAGL